MNINNVQLCLCTKVIKGCSAHHCLFVINMTSSTLLGKCKQDLSLTFKNLEKAVYKQLMLYKTRINLFLQGNLLYYQRLETLEILSHQVHCPNIKRSTSVTQTTRFSSKTSLRYGGRCSQWDSSASTSISTLA